MARRRRKKNATNKTALEFVESPAGGYPNIPSPVFCSDDPPTADVVPIEDGINFPWVSPQFRHPPSQRKRRRGRAQGGSTLNPRRGRLTGKENSMQPPAQQGRKITQKFTRLKFVGMEHSPTVHCDKSDDDVDTVTGAHTEMFLTPVDRRVTRSQSTGSGQYSRRRIPDVGNCNSATTPSLLDTSCQIPCDVSVDVANRHRLGGNQDGVSNACGSPMCETQRRPKTRQSTRRLFSTEVHMLGHTTTMSRSLDSVGDEDTEEPTCDNSVNTPILNRECCSSLNKVKVRTRRSTKPLWLFMNTPLKDTRPQPAVLVVDTPVEDYALPVRLRNLKYYRMLDKNNKSKLYPC